MKDDNKDPKQDLNIYNLTEIKEKSVNIHQYTSLITMFTHQIDLYNKAIHKLNHALELYHQTIGNLAQFADISTLQGETQDYDMEKLKIWLFSVEEFITKTIKQRPRQIQKIVQVEKLVQVETPVFIEKIVEVDRPITVIQQIEKEVEKIVYVEKTVQMPIFVERNSKRVCVKCSGLI